MDIFDVSLFGFIGSFFRTTLHDIGVYLTTLTRPEDLCPSYQVIDDERRSTVMANGRLGREVFGRLSQIGDLGDKNKALYIAMGGPEALGNGDGVAFERLLELAARHREDSLKLDALRAASAPATTLDEVSPVKVVKVPKPRAKKVPAGKKKAAASPPAKK